MEPDRGKRQEAKGWTLNATNRPKMNAGTFNKHRLVNRVALVCSFAVAFTCLGAHVAVAQEQQESSPEQVERFKDIQDTANQERIQGQVKKDETGTDPRVFSNKWMPYWRLTELENGAVQQNLTANGTLRFSDRVGMFYELPVAQHRDLSDVEGLPAGTDPKAIGMGDADLKFLWRPKALDFSYGKEGTKSGSVLLGTDFLLPTATDPALGGSAFLFAPIVAVVMDMPLHGFIAMLNLYYFDVYRDDLAPKTSQYVGKWFYMQPLSKPGPWWGGLFTLPELQPIYDFESEQFSLWVGVELGKMLAPGKLAYVKPGWGINNSEDTERKTGLEIGFRWFF
jgi:hypothetical protein